MSKLFEYLANLIKQKFYGVSLALSYCLVEDYYIAFN